MDDNPATERDAIWQPIDSTPMHPEYTCAHCTISGAVAAAASETSSERFGHRIGHEPVTTGRY